MTHRSHARIALAGTCIAVLAGFVMAPSAPAATATIGSALNLPYNGGVDTNAGTTSLQTSQVGGLLPFPITSPANGIVTEWKVRSGDDAALYTLRILRPAGANTYIGSGSVVAPQAVPGGAVDEIFTYPGNSLPISMGDSIAVKQDGTPDEGLPQNNTGGITANVIANRFAADGNFPDGAAVTFTPDAQHELLLQATIRFCRVPNLVGLTEAAAKGALTAAECTATPTVAKQQLRLKRIKKTLSKKKKNRIKAENKALQAKNGTVLSQGTAADTTAAPPGPAVALTVGEVVAPKKKKKKK